MWNVVRLVLALWLAALLPQAAVAQPSGAFPSRPIRILVGFTPGSSVDAMARLYAPRLSEVLGVPVIVENKPGAGGILAVRTLQLAPADGYTLHAAVGSTLAQGPALRTDLPYDPLKDFSLISFLGTVPGAIFVHADLPVATVADLVAYARARPGVLSYGSGGVGTAGHLHGEYFASLTGVKMVHVPYKSDPDAAADVASGRLQLAFANARSMLPLIANGKVKALAVTAAARLGPMAQVPTVAETGVKGLDGLLPFSFFGLVGPVGLPAPVMQKLGDAVNKVSAAPEVLSAMRDILVEPRVASPAEFRSFIEKEIAKWREVGRNVNLKDGS